MAMTPRTNMSTEAKKIFRELVKQMTELKILHPVDKFQIETAAEALAKARYFETILAKHEIGETIKVTEYNAIAAQQRNWVSEYNKICDKLGVSNTKRNPSKRERGRPKSGDGVINEISDKERKEWLKVVK